MRKIKVQTPAKINLTLEVLDKRPDGFHNIQSIMHTVSLCDFLTICAEEKKSCENEIILTGTSPEIPYDERNIVYKATKLYLEKTGIKNKTISINIEKNIPVSAGLAGGSTNASGAVLGLNELLGGKLEFGELHKIAAVLGSDLNFCLEGGCACCTGRGEIIEKLPAADFKLSILKPKNFGISAKEAYQRFAAMNDKSNPDNTSKMKALLKQNKFDKNLIYNSLEKAVLPYYAVLKDIKNKYQGSMMSGSGPACFLIGDVFDGVDTDLFDVFNDLTSVDFGVKVF